MAGILDSIPFDSIPIITVVLLALGFVGVMVYERTRTRQNEETTH